MISYDVGSGRFLPPRTMFSGLMSLCNRFYWWTCYSPISIFFMIIEASSSLNTGSVKCNFLPYSLSLNLRSDELYTCSSSDSEYSDSLSSLLWTAFVGEDACFVYLTCSISFDSIIVVAALTILRFDFRGDVAIFEAFVFRGIVCLSISRRFS